MGSYGSNLIGQPGCHCGDARGGIRETMSVGHDVEQRLPGLVKRAEPREKR